MTISSWEGDYFIGNRRKNSPPAAGGPTQLGTRGAGLTPAVPGATQGLRAVKNPLLSLVVLVVRFAMPRQIEPEESSESRIVVQHLPCSFACGVRAGLFPRVARPLIYRGEAIPLRRGQFVPVRSSLMVFHRLTVLIF